MQAFLTLLIEILVVSFTAIAVIDIVAAALDARLEISPAFVIP